ncbi:AraC-like DNA-binding protein [Paenibacillus phyllosphaerae]|uniref:AraC-like DNA-binding protein n=1 Tax=Paenibacillus phyllosphaerae TaxID=274593 RepID=A0A7W5B2J8_9BACL|nr:AraC family transcriptional regulator [Paenibacillus phyllosphaerae]MBB3113284.1 AraC-like DNA-binding protein [Paenibacillus phyllosphaerae]
MLRVDISRLDQALQGQLDLNVLFHGKEECEPLHSWGPGLRDSYIIHYIHSGRGVFRMNGQTYALTAGEGFLIPPGAIVHYEADEREPWVYTWIGFRGMQAKALLSSAGLDADSPIFRTGDRAFFECLHEELIAASQRRGSGLFFQSLLFRFLAELVECAEAPVRGPASPSKEAYVRKASEWIEHNYSQKITVLEIARYVGLNRTYLSSLFQEQYGVSLQTYLLHYRMNRAAALLRNRELSISDISRSVGYTDPFLFSKMFKKVIGMSPTASRAQAT